MNLVDDSSMWQCQELMHASCGHVYVACLPGEVRCMFVSQQGRKLHKLVDSLNHFFLSSVAEKTKACIDERI